MNKSVRNVASVNGPSQEEVIASLEADLELTKQIAIDNYNTASQLGGALEIAEGKISALQARVEELEKENALQAVVIAGKETNITTEEREDIIASVKAAGEALLNDFNSLEKHAEVLKAVKGVKAKKTNNVKEISVEV